jgi:hypothetical protein
MIVEQKNNSKQNKKGQLIQNYTIERVENFKHLSVTLNEDNDHLINFQESIKNSNKTYFMFMLWATFLHYFV